MSDYHIKPNKALGMGVILVLKQLGKVIEIPCKNRATAEYEAKRTIRVLKNLQTTR